MLLFDIEMVGLVDKLSRRGLGCLRLNGFAGGDVEVLSVDLLLAADHVASALSLLGLPDDLEDFVHQQGLL